MTFSYSFNPRGGYIIIKENRNRNSDQYMAEILDFPYNKYRKLLEKYGAHLSNSQYYFETEEAIKNFLNSEELLTTPYHNAETDGGIEMEMKIDHIYPRGYFISIRDKINKSDKFIAEMLSISPIRNTRTC